MPHTMARMGDVLAGFHAAWEFESDSVLIRFERGIRTPKLFQALGERRIPLEAIAAVTLTPGKRGTVVLRADAETGRRSADGGGGGTAQGGVRPLPARPARRARDARRVLRGRAARDARDGRRSPPSAIWWQPPEAPLHFKAYDGKASFDGKAVSFRWFWTGASSAKWKAGDQSFPVADLSGVEWRSPEVFEGHLRLLRREPADRAARLRPIRIRPPSSSGSGTGRCMSRCRSRRRCSRRFGARAAAVPEYRRRARRRLGGTRPTSPTGSGTSASCTRPASSRTRSSRRRRRSCWRSCKGQRGVVRRLRARRGWPRPRWGSPRSSEAESGGGAANQYSPAPLKGASLLPARRGERHVRVAVARDLGGDRAPAGPRSSSVRTMRVAAVFSSIRVRLRVPGMGTTGRPWTDACCWTQARAIWPSGGAVGLRRPRASAPGGPRWRPRCHR